MACCGNRNKVIDIAVSKQREKWVFVKMGGCKDKDIR
jgi:hypothetical protein